MLEDFEARLDMGRPPKITRTERLRPVFPLPQILLGAKMRPIEHIVLRPTEFNGTDSDKGEHVYADWALKAECHSHHVFP